MKRFINSTICHIFLLLLLISSVVQGQISSNTVKYQITYEPTSQVYTAWVVPDYNVPNANNLGTTELGGTAQFTIVVPKDFVITNITDIKGTWTKTTDAAFRKLGPGQVGQVWTGLDPTLNYYVIGKTPSETNYGTFAAGSPVSLFSFTGNSCYGIVKALPANDPFIAAADNGYGLNTGNSFYSRSGQPSGGNQKPLEQFISITGIPANCLPLQANPDNPTTTVGTSTTTNVLGNDTRAGTPVNPNNVTVSIFANPSSGTVTINADGTIKYTPNANFTGKDCYVYQICDKAIPTLCDTAKVCVTVTSGVANLKITKVLNGTTKVVGKNSIVSYTILIENLGTTNATNIVVKDSLGAGLQYSSNTVSTGTFSLPLWSIPVLTAGTSATLTISATVVSEGVSFNYVKIQSLDQSETTPTDNEDRACVSVPIKLCSGDSLEVSVPAQFTNVVWFNNGATVGTGNTLVISQIGSYTFQASNAQCPAQGCCPIVVEDGNCCRPNICVPFSVVKVKSSK
ncbi:MAG: Ig-like domain-containing protein [Bacteroidota bacterium]